MIWQTLNSYLEAQCHSITELLPLIHKKADEKAVHKLRVSVKKARACLHLAKQLTGHGFKGKKYVQLLKVLHQAVGALRDLHLQQTHLQHYTKSKPAHYRVYHLLLQQHYRLAARQAQAIAGAFPAAFIKELPGRLDKKQNHRSAPERTSALTFRNSMPLLWCRQEMYRLKNGMTCASISNACITSWK